MLSKQINLILDTAAGLKRRERLTRTVNTVVTVLFFSSIISVIMALLLEFRIISKDLLFLIPLILSASIIIPGGMEILKAVQPESLLLDADRKYKLHERLTTAYEIIVSKHKTLFFDLIIDDAAVSAKKIELKKIYPLKSTWRIKAVPVLLLSVGLLFSFNLPSLFSTIYSEGILLEEYAEVLASRVGEDESKEDIDLYREMEKLGKQMRQKLFSKEEVLDELKKLQEKVRQQIIGLERTPLPYSTFEPSEDGITDEFSKEIGRLQNNDMSESEIQELRTGISESGELTEGQKKRAEKSFNKYDHQSDKDGQDRLAEDLLDSLQSENKKDDEKLKDLQDIEDLLEKMADSITGNDSVDEDGKYGEGKESDKEARNSRGSEQTGKDRVSEENSNGIEGGGAGKESEKDQFDSTAERKEGDSYDTSQLEG
ncbi:MAG: hypothetical protein KAR21_02215, partial [Spirochaetales bacterium]|nr:hypothetical protein [Spirochaetales bacterium]